MPLMNAPYLLDEIKLALEALATRGQSRILFLSQFPMTPDDAAYIQEFLGSGKVMIQSGGSTPSVWRETGVSGVWWGEHYNSDRKVTLRTIEITRIPDLAMTPLEDVETALGVLRERLSAEGAPSCMKPV